MAARQYRQRMPPEQYFALDLGMAKTTAPAGAFADGATVNLLFAAAGGVVGVVTVPAVGMFVGKAWGGYGWGWSVIWPYRHHRPDGSDCLPPESKYARETGSVSFGEAPHQLCAFRLLRECWRNIGVAGYAAAAADECGQFGGSGGLCGASIAGD